MGQVEFQVVREHQVQVGWMGLVELQEQAELTEVVELQEQVVCLLIG